MDARPIILTALRHLRMCLENTEPPDLSTNGAVFVKIKEIRPIIKMIDFLRKLNLVLIAKSVFVWFYRAVFVTFKNSYYSGFSISDPPPSASTSCPRRCIRHKDVILSILSKTGEIGWFFVWNLIFLIVQTENRSNRLADRFWFDYGCFDRNSKIWKIETGYPTGLIICWLVLARAEDR
jgi:hypothetical protein